MNGDPRTWDIGDPEPTDPPLSVLDYTHQYHDPLDDDQPEWGRTLNGWKGYKGGYKCYTDWDDLVRRWGPLTEVIPGE